MTNNPRQPLNTLPRTIEQLTFSCCILWSLRWHLIFKLYRIYAKVNECIIFWNWSWMFWLCHNRSKIMCVSCPVMFCHNLFKIKKKTWSVGFFFPNIISIWSEANVMIDSLIPSFSQHYKIQFVNVIFCTYISWNQFIISKQL